MKFQTFADSYLEERSHEWKRPTWHRGMVRRLVALIGDVFLDEITPRRVVACLKPLRGRPFYNRMLRYLRTMLTHAISCGYLERNPTAGLKDGYQPGPVEKKPLDAKQRAALIAAADHELRPAIRFAFQTGMRWGEIAELTWDRIDLGKRIAKVVNSKVKGASREVPLTTEALAVLRGLTTPLDRSQTVFVYCGGPLIRYNAGRPSTRPARPSMA